MKKSKQATHGKYFETNWNNIKNTRKGTKSLVSLKTVASSVPTICSLDNAGDTTTNPYDIAHIFNNFFAFIAETMKKKLKMKILRMTAAVQYFCNLLKIKK